MKQTILVAALCALVSCGGESHTEKYQTSRDNIIDVSEELVEVDLGKDMLLGQGCVTIVGDYLLINDYTSKKELLHIFDRTSFDHVWSGLRRGRGRGEVIGLGRLTPDENKGRFFTVGKGYVMGYNVESLINNRDYKPKKFGSTFLKEEDFEGSRFTIGVDYVNDTLSFATTLSAPKGRGFRVSDGLFRIKGGAKQIFAFNTRKGGFNFVERSYPDDIEPFFNGTGSLEHNLIVEGHQSKDLLSLHDLEGNLICNVFGPDWDIYEEMVAFNNISIIGDRIFTTYSGRYTDEPETYPEAITTFDIEGNYIETLDFGVGIFSYTYDKKGDRLILFVESEESPIIYLDMKEYL